jgi:hypothetical protein
MTATLHWNDSNVEVHKLVVGPYDNNVFVIRCRATGDAVLIAADINNFLYDAGGTPNAIPVVSLFQDIDYEHKIFCKHEAQPRPARSGGFGNTGRTSEKADPQRYPPDRADRDPA